MQQQREYLARLGRYQAEGRQQRRERHLALPLGERLRRSMRLFEQFRHTTRRDHDDSPVEFYARARALKLISSSSS